MPGWGALVRAPVLLLLLRCPSSTARTASDGDGDRVARTDREFCCCHGGREVSVSTWL